ncbi:MAG: ABC transporter permease subunit, partial [Actinomycetota bacterium]|nr:ABC transporter permease subunit [Actinomycetota bacterium]
MLTLLTRALTPGALAETLGDSDTWRVVWFTTWQAVLSTVLTITAGLAPAYVCARYRFAGRRLLVGLLTGVFVLPTVVMGAAMLAVLPDSMERTVWAILAAHVLFNLAVVVRVVGAVWEHLPRELEHAAATLGASPRQVARHVTLPLLRPAIGAAGAIVFVFTFTSFGVVRILGGSGRTTVEVEVWRQATQLDGIDVAAVLTVVQLLLVGGAVAWSLWIQRRHRTTLALLTSADRQRPRTARQRVLVAATAAATALVVLIPLGAMFARSLRTPDGYSLAAWTDMGETEIRPGVRLGLDPTEAMLNSLRAAGLATLLAVVIGGLAALAIHSAGRHGRLLDAG